MKSERATWAVFHDIDSVHNGSGSTIGVQEVNNAELQAILYVLENHRQWKNITVVSDSLNAVTFCQKGFGDTNRLIRKTDNSDTKLKMKELIQERTQNQGSLKIQHICSHADDNSKLDSIKRNSQNAERFGDRKEEVEAKNALVDVMAGQEKWGFTPIDLNTTYDDFIIAIEGKPVTGNLRQNIKTHMYNGLHERWLTAQKSWSAFVHPGVWEGSYPRKTDSYTNLTCKIMTGSFWTGRRAKQWDENAKNSLGEPIEESHQHVLGECIRVVPLLDELWQEICGLFMRLGLSDKGINPWFNCPNFYNGLYEMPTYLGDKGLLPKELQPRIRQSNPHATTDDIKKIMRGIMYLTKNRIRAIYLSRFR